MSLYLITMQCGRTVACRRLDKVESSLRIDLCLYTSILERHHVIAGSSCECRPQHPSCQHIFYARAEVRVDLGFAFEGVADEESMKACPS